MKVLSIKQPWAWLIVAGHKDIENRTWRTKLRGRFLVHASQTIDKRALEELKRTTKIQFPANFNTGCIVGSVELVDCVDHHNSFWFKGPIGFILKDPKSMHPRPMKGKLGFFESPIDFSNVMRVHT